jgi:AraC-like DNA-binding protein
LAAVAAESGYSDQSHLGREVKRVTGLPPARFAERMKTDEAFWMYRLLGEHLRGAADRLSAP